MVCVGKPRGALFLLGIAKGKKRGRGAGWSRAFASQISAALSCLGRSRAFTESFSRACAFLLRFNSNTTAVIPRGGGFARA